MNEPKTAAEYLDRGCDKDEQKDTKGAIKDYTKHQKSIPTLKRHMRIVDVEKKSQMIKKVLLMIGKKQQNSSLHIVREIYLKPSHT